MTPTHLNAKLYLEITAKSELVDAEYAAGDWLTIVHDAKDAPKRRDGCVKFKAK